MNALRLDADGIVFLALGYIDAGCTPFFFEFIEEYNVEPWRLTQNDECAVSPDLFGGS